MSKKSVSEIDERVRYSNQARLLEEASHGLLELMNREGRNRVWLARRLDVSPSYVTKILEGSYNFSLETLADVYAALGRAVHITLGTDLEEMRFPTDESLEDEADSLEQRPLEPRLQALPAKKRRRSRRTEA